METLLIIMGALALTLITRTKYVNRKTITVNNMSFDVIITGYTWLFMFNKATNVTIISNPITLNINL